MNAAPEHSTLVVVVDGPSGSGKSSVSREVARRLGLAYLDTGAMYRALTWWCVDQGVPLDDEAGVTRAAESLPLVMGVDPDDPRVRVGETDVTGAIRETAVSSVVSQVARHLPARAVLIATQRATIESHAAQGIIAEGRDLTTVVAPDADIRLLVTASEEARLARRSRELHGSADASAVAATRDQVLRRDRDDSAVSSFLEPSDGVSLLDTSDLTFEESVQAVLALIDRRTGGRFVGSAPRTGE